MTATCCQMTLTLKILAPLVMAILALYQPPIVVAQLMLI